MHWRLLVRVFESKPIKRGGKILFQQFKSLLEFSTQMSSQITKNNYTTASTSPNPYISRKLNNMKKVQVMKKEWDDWTKAISQDVKRNRNDDQCVEDSEGYEEDSWSSKYNSYGNGRIYFNSKY